ncbi:peptide deformylase [bacterium]|uniref:Peptide deformylase n=2 Tax=Katanobacteria TaxID=422282 RepID=A0A2M7WZJ9_UNCKA|nr:peptide deformylase [bacterium]PIP56460.1 MAG: peptide deformylase [candidate division WWE3 bacterium CG22_combo_CG10-13_8_21_14_all_39_12]PJA38958.1 MAG: peptide deformylase [candidate division WWE3 bacterium CG_4_9_14_3_um_filter_39_7]
MLRQIIVHPNETLRKTASEVPLENGLSDEHSILALDLMETLESTYPLGAGLSANQVNQTSRIFVINLEVGEGHFMRQYFINPEIVKTSTQTITDWEGCLSIPDQWGHVERFKSVTVSAYNLKGEEFTVTAADFYARLVQHELDHLNGILFIDKLKSRIYSTQELQKLEEKKSASNQTDNVQG